MKAMTIPGRRPLLATAAVVALATAAWLGAPLAANAGDKVAAATTHAHAATEAAPVSVVRLPSDLPGPIGKRGPQRVKVDLETAEVTGQLADGTTYQLLDLQQEGSRTLRPRPGRRHRRGQAQEP